MKNIKSSNTRVTQFFAYVQIHGKDIIRLGDLQTDFQISPRQEKELLSYLARKGSIIRLKRGIYITPLTIPAGGKWQPDTKYLISCLMEVINAKYYIAGEYAFHYHGLTEQIPNLVTVYNDKYSGKRKIGQIKIQFIKKPSNKLNRQIIINTKNNRQANLSTLTRCIIDAVIDYKRYNTLPKAYDWINAKINDPNFLVQLVKEVIQYGNISAKRRIGYTLYTQTQDDNLVKPILNTIKSTHGWIALAPHSKLKGKTNKQWRIIDNVK